jgi:sec-independent protein translocase protein TatC
MVKYIIEIKYRISCILIVFLTFMLTMTVYKFYVVHFFLWVNPRMLTSSLGYLILTSVTELFNVFLDLCFCSTKFILYYFAYYHTVSFMALGLYKREYFYLKRFFTISIILWVLSTSLFLNMFLPLTYDFFFSFQYVISRVYFEPKVVEYFNFVLNVYSQSYLCFQLLLIFVAFLKYTKTDTFFIKSFKKIVYIIMLFVATIITPPDVLNQIGVFLFLILSIEIYIFSSFMKKNLDLTLAKK